MRVSTSQQFESYLLGIRAAQERMVESQERVMTGKKIQTLRDDPIGGSLILRARSLKSSTEQYDRNLRVAQEWLGFSDGAISEMKAMATKAYELAVRAANSATDQFGREAMVQEVQQLQKRLIQTANARGASSQFLFGGQRTDVQPFVLTGSTVAYMGDSNPIAIEVSAGETLQVNSQISASVADLYETLESFKTHLLGGDIGAISGVDIAAIKDSLRSLDADRASIGARVQTVHEQKAHNDRRIDELTKRISDIEEIDMAEAISQYQLAQTAYSAALQVASQGYGLSLMDFMRS